MGGVALVISDARDQDYINTTLYIQKDLHYTSFTKVS